MLKIMQNTNLLINHKKILQRFILMLFCVHRLQNNFSHALETKKKKNIIKTSKV